MDINFPLILFCLVLAGAVIWLADSIWLAKKRRPDDKVPVLIENARSLTPVLALVFVIRSFLYEPFQIPSGSMEKTLLIGDFILVNKYTYGIRLPVIRNKVIDLNEPQRGDVMVFFPPGRDQYFIKRVVGLPGDLIEYSDKVLTINGVEQVQTDIAGQNKRSLFKQKWEQLGEVEHQIQQNIAAVGGSEQAFSVADGHYFMMGDNRDNSSDSRVWGAVHESRIVGKAVAIWMHKEPGWNMPTFSRLGSIK
jgi:signal peptidase I